MTKQEAIMILDGFDLRSNADKYDIEALNIAQDALEKQLPKKVSEQSFFKPLNEIIGECPSCSSAVPLQCLYCFRCGQALDWSDEK